MLKTKEEIWKPVRGYEDLYEVSSLGKIRKVKKEKILKPINTRTGYKAIYLTKNYEKEYKLMHRLIGETFSSSTINECIDHINGVKDDNRADNLKWCSCIENSNNPLTIGRKKKPKTKHNRIVSTDQNGSEKIYRSVKEAASDVKGGVGGIYYALYGKFKTYKGRTWRDE